MTHRFVSAALARASLGLPLGALCALVLAACTAQAPPRQPGEPVRTHWATNLPRFDLQACFPRTDRDWGGDTRLDAMWVAVSDTFPRLDECINNHFFNEGEFDGEVEVALRVQPDHTVAIVYETDVDHPVFRTCIDQAFAMIDLPRSSEPAGHELRGTYTISEGGDDILTVDGSKLGTVVGRIRTRALDSCGCFERYRDTMPPDMKFKFNLATDDPHPKRIKVVGDIADQDLAECLAEHLASIPIASFDKEIGASYRFKFSNSRVFDVARLVADGREAANRLDLATAERLYRRALEREPDHIDALEGMGGVEFERGNFLAARTWYERALALDEDNAAVLHGIGLTWQATDEHVAAIEWFERAIDAREGFVAHVSIARSYLARNQPDEARDHAARSRKLNPDFALAYIAEAMAAHAEGDDEDALELLHQATRLDLDDVSSWNGLLVVYIDLGRHDEAAAVARQARERGFDAAVLRYNEGVALEGMRRSNEAATAFCEAARLEPDNADYTRACARYAGDEK